MVCRKDGNAPLGGRICGFASQAWLFMQLVQMDFIYVRSLVYLTNIRCSFL
jgi:hypothetical protein